jgi:hypothetical protein
MEETFQRLSLAQRNQDEQRKAEKENRAFYVWSPVEQESLPAPLFAGVAVQSGADTDRRESARLRMPLGGIGTVAMVL